MVKATPVWPSTILLRTYDEGTRVGYGPAVSDEVIVQESLDELLVVVVVDVAVVVLSFLQELANGAIAANPNAANPPDINDFLSII